MVLRNLIRSQLERGFRVADTTKTLRSRLLRADRMVTINIPHPLKPGRTIQGYRVQHNNLLGPYKGGIRITGSVCPDELLSLASWMTMKCSLFGLPLGGGKGGINLDLTELEGGDGVELEKIVRTYTRGISPLIGDNIDIPAPDINTTSMMMDWMFEEYNTGFYGNNFSEWEHVVTGKSVDCFGLPGRTEATGVGVYQVLESYLALHDTQVLGKTFCIQGLGNVGYHLAKKLLSRGAILVGAGDLNGYYVPKNEGYKRQGPNRCLDLEDVLSVGPESEGCKNISKREFLQTPCDIMILAASHLQIDREKAEKLQCQIVLEAANGPLDMEADKICRERGIVVIPDILANGGGVQASYYEMSQTLDMTVDIDIIVDNNSRVDNLGRLTDKMERVTSRVIEKHQQLQTTGNYSLRDASYCIALDNLERAWKDSHNKSI